MFQRMEWVLVCIKPDCLFDNIYQHTHVDYKLILFEGAQTKILSPT